MKQSCNRFVHILFPFLELPPPKLLQFLYSSLVLWTNLMLQGTRNNAIFQTLFTSLRIWIYIALLYSHMCSPKWYNNSSIGSNDNSSMTLFNLDYFFIQLRFHVFYLLKYDEKSQTIMTQKKSHKQFSQNTFLWKSRRHLLDQGMLKLKIKSSEERRMHKAHQHIN